MAVIVHPNAIERDGVVVEEARLLGFHERFDGLTGRAWLEIVGPGWIVPMDASYGAVRKAIRVAFPKLPFTSDWSDGRFPRAPLGLPPDLVFSAAVALTVGIAMAFTVALGPLAGIAAAVSLGWPVSRLRDGVAIRKEGLRLGPPWASEVPWHEVEAVHLLQRRRYLEVYAQTKAGGASVAIPAVLAPAVRARLWRLGGIAPTSVDPIDARYQIWRAPAAGLPWGILAAALVAPWFTSSPWTTLAAGLLAASATALLGAAVEARATNWGTGAVLYGTGVYAVVLAALALQLGGFFGG